MSGNTLDKMANGGIYDHLGGGFARDTALTCNGKFLILKKCSMTMDN